MNPINIESILTEKSPQAPSGEVDLASDPAFIDLEIKIEGTPEREFDGKTIQEAKAPNWKEVQEAAVELLSRSHDLRVAMFLTRTLLHTNGVDGLGDGLALLQGMVDRYWGSLYPLLDPEDGNDPMQRLNILAALSLGDEILSPLRQTSLCASDVMGQFCFRDVLIASGKIDAPGDDQKTTPKIQDIEAAFKDSDADYLMAQKTGIAKALKHLAALRDALVKKIDASQFEALIDFAQLNSVLMEMEAFMDKQLEGRRVAPSPDSGQDARAGGNGDAPPDQASQLSSQRPTDVINGRRDVIRLLDKICLYYEQNEPGSPVPLLLKRAGQLVDKNFIEIIQDLAPDSADKLNHLLNATKDSQ